MNESHKVKIIRQQQAYKQTNKHQRVKVIPTLIIEEMCQLNGNKEHRRKEDTFQGWNHEIRKPSTNKWTNKWMSELINELMNFASKHSSKQSSKQVN